jgi:Fe-S oxidoreductase
MTACEGMDSRIVDVVLGRRGSAALPRMPRGAGWLLVEVTGEGPAQAASAAAAVVASAGALDARVVTHPVEQLALWRVREDGAGLAARSPVPSGRPGQSGWEDSAVPPERLGAYLRSFDALLDDYGYAGVPYGHFGEGCVHVRIDFGLSSAQGRTSFRSFLTAAAGLVASYGGSLSGEHGDGRARSELLPAMYSPQALSLFERFKALLDPDDLLNPGVLVRPRPVDADLRLARPLREPVASLRLVEDAGSLVDAVHRCTGVGRCLADNTGSGGVMCPSYLATRREKDSTRGRARVLQEMVNGDMVSGGWRSPEVHEALELCLACKGCSSDCPTGVDMATYKVEALHARYRRRIRPRSHYALGQLPRWLRRGTAVAPLANRLLSSPLARDAVKVVAGVDRRRALPELTGRSFRSWAAGRPDPADPEVVVWADTFTDHLAAGVGEALVAVLEGAGLRVGVVGEEACCGLTWLSTGQLAGARRAVAGAVEALHPYVARGVPVVGAEPSCVAALRSDAVQLTSDPRATEVARGVLTLAEMLSRRQGWRPPDLAGLEVVVQPHCHHASVLGWEADALLLAATGAQVTRVGGCCGLAGSWGMEKGHYEVSVAIAEHSLLPAVREAGKDAVVVADGFSCRTQLTDLAGVRAVHLAELLVGRHGGRASG